MRTKLIALAGALLLVAACESTPEDTVDTSGTGTGGPEQRSARARRRTAAVCRKGSPPETPSTTEP